LTNSDDDSDPGETLEDKSSGAGPFTASQPYYYQSYAESKGIRVNRNGDTLIDAESLIGDSEENKSRYIDQATGTSSF
jgi:hypothetical protein